MLRILEGMARFSRASERALGTCHESIQGVLREAIKEFDFTVLCGHRGKEEQEKAFAEGTSKVRWPKGKHNCSPSLAVDIAPYPIDWKDHERFTYLAGRVMGIAQVLGVKLRWGGDWDRDTEVQDEGFRDIGHFELV